MVDYTKRGGLKKLLDKFTKNEIASMYIENLIMLKELKSTMISEEQSSSSPTRSFSEKTDFAVSCSNESDGNVPIINISDTFDINNDDAIKICMGSDDCYNSINLFENIVNNSNVSEHDVLDVSPTQVLNKPFSDEGGNVNELSNNLIVSEQNILNVSPTQVVKKSFSDDDGKVNSLNRNNQFNCDVPFENLRNFDDDQFENPGDKNSSSLYPLPLNDILQRMDVLEENNKLLQNKIYDVEVKSASNDQYSRRNNFEIAGIPENINHDKLESTVCNLLNKLNIKVGWNDIEACHRLKNHPRSIDPAKTIVRFVNRKHTLMALSKKKVSKDIDFGDILGDSNKIFISENLCPSYREIYDAAYKLLKNGVIKHLWSFKGVVHIRL